MEYYDDFTAFRIPQRGRTAVYLDFDKGRIKVRINTGGRESYPRAAARHIPALLVLVGKMREDNTLPLPYFNQTAQLLENETDKFDVFISPETEGIRKIEPNENCLISFNFDAEHGSLVPLAQNDGTEYKYDKSGVFYNSCGEYFTVKQINLIDPYLDKNYVIPAVHLKIYFKVILPMLSKNPNIYSSLEYDPKPPFEAEILTDSSDFIRLELKWRIPFGELNFFIGDNTICEAFGVVMPSCGEIEEIPDELREDGEYTVYGRDKSLIEKLYTTIPNAFKGKLREIKPTETGSVKKARERREMQYNGRLLKRCALEPVAPSQLPRSRSLESAMRTFANIHGVPCGEVRYNDFTPSFDKLDRRQRSYYLYLRERYRNFNGINADYSYMLLIIYEALNTEDSLELLYYIWQFCREKHRRLDNIMPSCIRDYCVIYNIDTPFSAIYQRVPFSLAHTAHFELYLDSIISEGVKIIPASTYEIISDYEFKKSKIYTEANREAFIDSMRKALIAAEAYYKDYKNENFIARYLDRSTSYKVRAYNSALASEGNSYEIEYTYVHFINPEFRHFTGEIFRICDNILRKRIGIRGRVREDKHDAEFKKYIEDAFKEKKKPVRVVLDISAAEEIEKSSWDITERLIKAAGTGTEEPYEEYTAEETDKEAPEIYNEPEEATGYSAFITGLSPVAADYLKLVFERRSEAEKYALASSALTLPDSLEDEINTLAADCIGDVIIENGSLVEDYRDELNNFLY